MVRRDSIQEGMITPEVTEFIAAFDRTYAKVFMPEAPLTHHISLRAVARELGIRFNSPAFKSRVEEMVKEGTLRFAPGREAKDNLLIRMPGVLHEQSIGLVAKRPAAKATPVAPEVTKEPNRYEYTWSLPEGKKRFTSSAYGDSWADALKQIQQNHPKRSNIKLESQPEPAIPKAEAAMSEVPVAKEPWQMTQKEWLVDVGYKPNQGTRVRENWLGTHEGEVRVAVQNRKPVPPEVLKDYPGLVKAKTRREQIMEFDYAHTLDELKRMAREKGVSPSGTKHAIIARLI